MYKQVAMELAYDLLPGMEKQLKIATDALKFCSVHLKSMESYSIIDGALFEINNALKEIEIIENSVLKRRDEDQGVY